MTKLLKLSKSKIALGRRLGRKMARKHKMVKVREPLYDEIYFKGIEWMNRL